MPEAGVVLCQFSYATKKICTGFLSGFHPGLACIDENETDVIEPVKKSSQQ